MAPIVPPGRSGQSDSCWRQRACLSAVLGQSKLHWNDPAPNVEDACAIGIGLGLHEVAPIPIQEIFCLLGSMCTLSDEEAAALLASFEQPRQFPLELSADPVIVQLGRGDAHLGN